MLLADTLTDTDGTGLASHTPEKGGAWTKHTNSTPTPTIQGNGLVSSTSGAAWAHSAATPSGAAQEINAIVVMGASATNEPGICARMDTSATTFYDVRYVAASGRFELFKTVAGTETSLGTFAFANVPGSIAYVTFNCTDTAKQVFVGGDLVIESTDNAITATGKLGVRVKGTDTAGALLGRVWASDGYVGSIDSFNNSYDDSAVTNRAGALRARWTKGPGQSGVIALYTPAAGGYGTNPGVLPGGGAHSAAAQTAYYVIVAQPSTANYDVSAIVHHRQTTPDSQVSLAGPTGRGNVLASPSYYTARYNATIGIQAWELVKLVANVTTTLGWWAEANVVGALSHVTLEMVGTTINMWVDGVLRVTVVDSAITGAGLPGWAVRAGTTTAQSDRVQVALFEFAGSTVTDAAGPATPTLSTATPKVAAVDLVWTAVSDVGSAGLKGYRVESRLTGGSGPWTMSDVVFTGTSGTVWGLPTGTSYDFRIRAEDNAGNLSLASNAIAATPTVATPQPPAYNALTGTHSGSVTVNQASLTVDASQGSVYYEGGKTTFPDDPAFDVGAVCTLRAIVQPDTVPSLGTRRTLIERVNAYSLKMNGPDLEGTVYIGATPVTATAADVFSVGTTVDATLTYDGANLQLWDAGVEVGVAVSATGAVDAVSTDIVVGDGFIGFIQQPEVLAEALLGDRLAQDALAFVEEPEDVIGEFTIASAPWLEGTLVSVYPAAAWPEPQLAPSGVAATSTVASESVTFSGLDMNVRYVAYAAGHGVLFLVPDL